VWFPCFGALWQGLYTSCSVRHGCVEPCWDCLVGSWRAAWQQWQHGKHKRWMQLQKWLQYNALETTTYSGLCK
jgi:hypothetical protein